MMMWHEFLCFVSSFVVVVANDALNPPDAASAHIVKGVKGASQFGEKLTFELPDNEKACFYEKFEKVEKYTFEFRVLKGGHNDVDVVIKSPNGNKIYKKVKETADNYEFETSLGVYEICFSNEFSTITHKVVYFELRPSMVGTLAKEAGMNPKATAHTQLEESMESVHQQNSKVVDYQTEYRLHEAQGRYVAEGLNVRVQWWSMGQAIVILLAGLGQVFILRTFFAEHGPTGASETKNPLFSNIRT